MRWVISIDALNRGIWRKFPFPAPSRVTSTRTSSGSRIYPRPIATDLCRGKTTVFGRVESGVNRRAVLLSSFADRADTASRVDGTVCGARRFVERPPRRAEAASPFPLLWLDAEILRYSAKLLGRIGDAFRDFG